MKKMLLCLSFLMLCGIASASDILKWQATELAYKTTDDWGNWSEWSDWEDCSVLIVINTATDRVNIYSSTPQEYDVYDTESAVNDNDGGSSITFHCVDANGLRCDMRIRVKANGQVQLYIDYNDIMFVYNVEAK
jgi:hypothetical protein